MKVLMYDPPSGWLFGFPKVYAPLPGESLEDCLVRDGYPSWMLEVAKNHTRYWETEDMAATEADKDASKYYRAITNE